MAIAWQFFPALFKNDLSLSTSLGLDGGPYYRRDATLHSTCYLDKAVEQATSCWLISATLGRLRRAHFKEDT